MKKQLAIVAVVVTVLCLLIGSSAFAEGSRDLIAKGVETGEGERPFLEWDAGNYTSGVERINVLQVYAKAGETIYLGSSVDAAYDGKDIVVRDPSGTETAYDVSSEQGFINSLTKELAGPNVSSEDGYAPIAVQVEQTGIWEVEFHGYATSKTLLAANAWAQRNPNCDVTVAIDEEYPKNFRVTWQKACVAAWDVSVYDENGVYVPGRTFTNYVAMNCSRNKYTSKVLNAQFYILTKDGYQYAVDMNGMDPYGFVFFANNRGMIDKTTNTSVYHSVNAGDNEMNNLSRFNIEVQRPDAADTVTNITHRVFFNAPASDLPESIPTKAQAPAQADSFRFTGTGDGTTTVQTGGFFSFVSDKISTYNVTIAFEDPSYQDVVIGNSSVVGSNSIYWDGKDANGKTVPAGSYTATLQTNGGEYHFPLLDAEVNNYGLKIVLQNPPYVPDGFEDDMIYYNATNFTAGNGVKSNVSTSGAPSPQNATGGVLSENGAFAFTDRWGDMMANDVWTYFPGDQQSLTVTVEDSSEKVAFLSGYVFYDADESATWDYEEGPLGEIVLKITDANGDEQLVTTDGAGHYSASIPFGAYTVSVVDKKGYNKVTTNNATITGTATKTLNNLADIGLVEKLDVATTVSVSGAEFGVGDTIVYTVTATNNSSLTANGVKVQAALPANIQDAATEDASYDIATGLWTIGTLGADETKTVTITATLTKEGSYIFNSVISCTEQDIDPSNDTDETSYVVVLRPTLATKDYADQTDVNTPVSSETPIAAISNMEDAAFTYTLTEQPAFGSVVLNSDGTWVYTPDGATTGQAVFYVTVTDQYGCSAVSTITIDVIAPLTPPSGIILRGFDRAYIFGYEPREDGDGNLVLELAPDDSVTREQVAAMLVRTLEQQTDRLDGFAAADELEAFQPVASNHWSFYALSYMESLGTFDGKAHLSHAAPVTRGEVAKLVAFALELTDEADISRYKDVSYSQYAEYIAKVVACGYMQGDDATTFAPNRVMTRAEFCTMFNNILERDEEHGYYLETADGEVVDHTTYYFTDMDNRVDEWYYLDMIYATSAFDNNGYVDVETRLANIRNILDHYNGQTDY